MCKAVAVIVPVPCECFIDDDFSDGQLDRLVRGTSNHDRLPGYNQIRDLEKIPFLLEPGRRNPSRRLAIGADQP